VAETVLLALTIFAAYTTIGGALAHWSRVHPSRLLVASGLLMAIVASLRMNRLRSWGRAPLMFDDDPPDMVQPLNLS
jgi:hypothetical protein